MRFGNIGKRLLTANHLWWTKKFTPNAPHVNLVRDYASSVLKVKRIFCDDEFKIQISSEERSKTLKDRSLLQEDVDSFHLHYQRLLTVQKTMGQKVYLLIY